MGCFVWPTDFCQLHGRRSVSGVRREREGARLDRGHDRTSRRRARIELRRDVLRLALREVEEARQDLLLVRAGEDLRQLVHGREAKAPVAERLDDRRVRLHEAGCGLSVEGCAVRESEPVVEVVEQRAVPEVGPPALGVEVREGDEEVGERVALVLQELGESVGEFARSVHERIVSLNFEASPDARIRLLPRDLDASSRAASARRCADRRLPGAFPRPAAHDARSGSATGAETRQTLIWG
jgi:hypothetical protein